MKKTESQCLNILIISSTAASSVCATGALKAKLFGGFSAKNLMQIYTGPEPTQKMAWFLKIKRYTNFSSVLHKVQYFNPDVIYFCPTEGPEHLNRIAYKLIEKIDVPIVTHIMDDWITSVLKENPYMYADLHPQLNAVIRNSKANLSICDKMSIEFRKRYDREFTAVANFVNSQSIIPIRKRNAVFTIRYCGGLAIGMNRQSVKDFVNVIEIMHMEGIDLVFEIYTMPWYQEEARKMSTSTSVKVFDLVDESKYDALLATADLLLLAYNFDEKTLDYARFSMSNKLPECVMSGTPLLVYGSEEIATVSYCVQNKLAEVVIDRSRSKLLNALRKLIANSREAIEIAKNAQKFYLANHSELETHAKFKSVLTDSARKLKDRPKVGVRVSIYGRLHLFVSKLDFASRFSKKITHSIANYLRLIPTIHSLAKKFYHLFAN